MDKPSIDELENELEPVPHAEEKGLERQIFDWEGWDQFDTTGLNFYNVTLKVPVGEFPAGTKFSSADVDFGRSVMSLYVEDGPRDERGHGMLKEVFRGKLTMTVDQIPIPDNND